MTLTSLGVQPTDCAVLSRSQDEDVAQPASIRARVSPVTWRMGESGSVEGLAELDGFRNMGCADLFSAGQIGNGASNAQQPVIGARR